MQTNLPPIDTRLKLSALWVSVMFCFIYADYFELYVPEKVETLLTGSNILDTPVKLLTASVILIIPAIMISLSLLGRPSIVRWLHIILGSLYAIMMLGIGIMSITPWYSFYVLYAFVECILSMFIVRQAWNWTIGKN